MKASFNFSRNLLQHLHTYYMTLLERMICDLFKLGKEYMALNTGVHCYLHNGVESNTIRNHYLSYLSS